MDPNGGGWGAGGEMNGTTTNKTIVLTIKLSNCIPPAVVSCFPSIGGGGGGVGLGRCR